MKNLSNPQAIPEQGDLPRHAADLFQQTDEALRELGEVYEKKHVAVDRPRDGNVVYADGSDWNPGFGEGFYFYSLAQWFPMFNVGPRRITEFTSSGSYAKPTWLRQAIVMCKGGGGGGGTGTTGDKSGGGGGEAAVSFQLYLASALAASVTVTIGAGGAAETAGGTTSFGSQTAVGGGAAADDQAGAGGASGASSAFVIRGACGVNGFYGSEQNGGAGGGVGAGRGAVVDLVAGENAAANSGAGGGGGGENTFGVSAPGTGGSGRVIIFEF